LISVDGEIPANFGSYRKPTECLDRVQFFAQ